jgi:hypothetical protein
VQPTVLRDLVRAELEDGANFLWFFCPGWHDLTPRAIIMLLKCPSL